MRKIITIILFVILIITILFKINDCEVLAYFSGKQLTNYAICIDGNNNNMRIGMDTINEDWTLEAWIKGNDTLWKDKEAIIGAGEYGNIEGYDYLPLYLSKGRLSSKQANISSDFVLDTNWHHAALTCNGQKTILYLDGVAVDSSNTKVSIIPGAIGVNCYDSTTFGGLIDEVRIWQKALNINEINQWMYKPIDQSHPYFDKLKGYYNFEDVQEDMTLNLVGKGHQNFHLRNGRNDYYKNSPLAFKIVNHNPKFQILQKHKELFNAVCIQNEWDVMQGMINEQALKLRIVVSGNKGKLRLNEVKVNFDGSSNISDIAKVQVFYTGSTPVSKKQIKLFESDKIIGNEIVFSSNKQQSYSLERGVNYFLVTLDVSSDATVGNKIEAKISSFKLNDIEYFPEIEKTNHSKTIIHNAINDDSKLTVLQWNIWHGGNHLGNNGIERVIDIIKASRADIIFMQEAYGNQKRIADSLNFYFQTPSERSNLALFSRFPLQEINCSYSYFKSIAAIVKIPNGKDVLLGNWWLPYAYCPEYTTWYLNKGLDPNKWIEEDKRLSEKDAIEILKSDINPVLSKKELPVIIGGDFNSGSHLDWTEQAKELHSGYGPIDFPTSKTMLKNGYKDSYREIHPNEVTHQGGTWAVIFGHLQNSRIDYIYYKGKGIKAISSKTIRTPYETDYVWPGDHAAVTTMFEIN